MFARVVTGPYVRVTKEVQTGEFIGIVVAGVDYERSGTFPRRGRMRETRRA
jgi:hypothetical protein